MPPPPPQRGPGIWPPTKADIVGFVLSAAVGVAIWWPTMAMQPRYDYSHPPQQTDSGWYVPLMVGAAVLLAVAFWKRWWVVVPGLLSAQLLLSPFTTPRGDNDGLWVLIVPMLVVFGVMLALLCWGVAALVRLGSGNRHA